MSTRIRSYETDPRGRLQAPILCKLLQEAATLHAAELGVSVESLVDSGVAWVLNRLRLEVNRWPGTGEEIVVETWPEALDRLRTERRFKLCDEQGGLLGSAVTLWLIIDLERRRPLRIPARIAEALAKHGLGNRPCRPDEIAAPGSLEHVVEFTVRRSDLDLAGHVNNTSYVEWAVEAVPDEVWAENDLAELEVSYLAECRRGSSVISGCRVTGDGVTREALHELRSKGDEVAVARARTSWRSRQG